VRVARRRTILWKLTASLTGEYGSNASRKARVSKNPSAVGLEPLSNDLNGVLPGCQPDRVGNECELFHTTTLHPLTSTMDRAVARISGLLILSVLSTACNAAWLAGYTKQGVTDRQKSSDYYECRKESTVVRNRGKGMQEEVSDMDKLNSCMRARGYAVSVETPS